jgi:methylmalonyl-CoA mutase cobalamin-binding subunit
LSAKAGVEVIYTGLHQTPELKRLRVAEVFTPGAGTDEIVEHIRGAVRSEQAPA